MLLIEHIVEVVRVNSFDVVDDLRFDRDKSLHVVCYITSETGAGEPE